MALIPRPCAGDGNLNEGSNWVAPAFRRLPRPLIIIGMHRSGTSLVSGMLSLLGVYLDQNCPQRDAGGRVILPDEKMRREGYGEAQAFRRLNERILMTAGADWMRIEPFLKRRDERAFRKRSLLRMQTASFTSLKSGYLGCSGSGDVNAWGWKDPRNSLTLPYWLALFPNARVLHVRRDPDATVGSLVRRAAAESTGPSSPPPSLFARASRVITDPAYRARTIRKRTGFGPLTVASVPDVTIDWQSLTNLYVSECERARILGSRYMEVQYEDILREPYSCGLALAEFAQLSPSLVTLRQSADFVIREPVQIARPLQRDTNSKPSRSTVHQLDKVAS